MIECLPSNGTVTGAVSFLQVFWSLLLPDITTRLFMRSLGGFSGLI